MGGYADVDHLGEGDMDSSVCAIDWHVGVALPQARNDEREVATESACVRGDDRGDSNGSRYCGLYRFGHFEGPRSAPTPYARA